MTERVLIQDLGAHVGETVTLKGWLYNRRSSGKLHFIELRDGTGIVQCVMGKNDVPPEVFAAADHITQESSLEITGQVKAHPKRPGVFEIGATGFQLIAPTAGEYPISPKEHGTDFLMDHRHLWLRSKRQHICRKLNLANALARPKFCSLSPMPSIFRWMILSTCHSFM